MAELATEVGERTMVGRTGGAPTFAVGMAHLLSGVLGSRGALALWYHFAIMFEALFILTTIDAGTRVGRFLMQDLLGLFSPASGTPPTPGAVRSPPCFSWVAGAGFSTRVSWIPSVASNSLWPIFGVANQLLAVLALALGTTVLIKMGRLRYLWVTLAPLVWLVAVTISAGWMKIFSEDPRLGFLRIASDLRARLAGGGTELQLEQWRHLLLNQYVNTAVTASFLVLVLLVLAANVQVWWQLLSGRRRPELREEPSIRSSPSPELVTCQSRLAIVWRR